jgi:hypothetical protein
MTACGADAILPPDDPGVIRTKTGFTATGTGETGSGRAAPGPHRRIRYGGNDQSVVKR